MVRLFHQYFLNSKAVLSTGFCAVVLLLFAQQAYAVDASWNGTLGTTWNTNGNWSGNSTPGAGDNAVFSSTFTNQPNLTANTTLGGLWMKTGVGQDVIISATAGVMTLNGNTINGTAGLGILVDNTSPFSLTIDAPLKLGNNQTWMNSSGNLLTIGAGGVDTNNRVLTIDGTGNTTISGVVFGGGSLNKAGSGTLILSGANTFTGVTTLNAGTLQLAGAGTLGATNSALTVNGGTLDLNGTNQGAGNLTGSGGTILNNNSGTNVTLTIGNGGATGGDYSGVIADHTSGTGTVSLTKTDSGTLSVSGANSYSGPTVIIDGALVVSSLNSVTGGSASSSLGAPVTVANGTIALGANTTTGQLTYAGTGETTDRVINLAGTTGGGTIDQSGTGTLAFSSDFTATGAGDKTLLLQGSTSGVGLISGAIVNNSGANTTSLVKDGTGTWTLTGANTYTGTTTVSGGVLNIQNANALGGTAGGTIVSNGGALQLQGDIAVLGEGLTLHGTGIASDGAMRNVSGNNSWSGPVTLAADSMIGSDSGTLTINGIISGGKKVIKVGAGTVIFSGANNYTGGTLINAGVLNIQSNTGTGTPGGGVTVSGGAALQVQGGITIGNENLTLNGSGIANDGALRSISGNNSWAGNFTLNSDSRIASDAGTLTLTGDINSNGFLLTVSGAGNVTASGLLSGTGSGLTKSGTGTLTLSGTANNTYNGVTMVTNGELDLNMKPGAKAISGTLTVGNGVGASNSAITRWFGSNQIPNPCAVTVNGDGLMDLNNYSDVIGTLTMTSGNVTTGTGVLTLGGNVTGNASATSATISGNLGLGGNRTFTIADGTAVEDMIVSATVSGGNSVTKNGAGTLVFSGPNTYTGGTTINAGVLNIQNSTGTGTPGGGVTVNSGAALQVQGGIAVGNENLTLKGDGIASDGALRNISGNNSWAGTVTLGSASTIASDAGTLTLAGSVNIAGFALTASGVGNTVANGVVSGTGGVTKNGTGSVTVTAANTYSGGTTVNGGSLFVNNTTGSGTGTGNVTVSGGTLGGNGTINASVTLAPAANLSPGATGAGSTAVLRTGNLTLSSGSNFVLDLNNTSVGTGYDLLNVTGTVDVTGSNLVLNPALDLAINSKFFVVANDGTDAITGTFAQGTTITAGIYTFLINYADNYDGGTIPNDISLTVTAIVPEPSTWAAAAFIVGVVGFDFFRRRRAQRQPRAI